jgi:diaminopimelate epimerase
MSQLIYFTKMHGLGNDFVVIDAVSRALSLSHTQIRRLADRHWGIGCDQILLVEKSPDKDHDFFYRIYNADGSESGQCGNGARCLAKFIHDKNLSTKNTLSLKTLTSQLEIYKEETQFRVNMGIPQDIEKFLCTSSDKEGIKLSLGNPHIVFITKIIEDKHLSHAGLEDFNVGFMQIVDRTYIKLRVFERGAGETYACGSGACAAVIAGITQNLLNSAVTVELPGGKLYIEWEGNTHSVWMRGPAKTVFEGTIDLSCLS